MSVALVTGARGFIARHLVRALRERGTEVLEIARDSTADARRHAIARAEVVYHLAGVNRPADPSEFQTGNAGFTQTLLEEIAGAGRKPIVVLASSTQAALDNPYGRSKLAAEQLVERAAETGIAARIYRLPNVFGPGCRPHYNSAVATFCHLAARGQALPINNPASRVRLVYVNDVVDVLVRHLDDRGGARVERPDVAPVFETSVGALAESIEGFASARRTPQIPDIADPFESRLYATFLSYRAT